jgi:alkyl hydroperoxide reductase subunit AhpC
MPSLRLGAVAPDFEALTTQGNIKFHDWIGDSWAVLFSHPASVPVLQERVLVFWFFKVLTRCFFLCSGTLTHSDFTPVCTTELGEVARRQKDFAARNTKVIGISCNELKSHEAWISEYVVLFSSEPNTSCLSSGVRAGSTRK